MLDQLEKDLNSLRNKSRRHQIQMTTIVPTPITDSQSQQVL